MSNTIQIRDNQGQAVYPITDESLIIGLNERFQQMTNRSYTITWDGTAAPTVANIPAGVVVTYNGTNYTGTLAASENTFNYIYLVKNGNNYDQYVTSSGAGTYTWVFMGTTEIDLSDYATKNDLNQLGQEIGELANIPEIESGQVNPYTGAKQTSTTRIRTANYLRNRPMTLKVASGYQIAAVAYYDATNTYITGVNTLSQEYTTTNYAYPTYVMFSIRKADDSAISVSDPYGLVIDEELAYSSVLSGDTIGNLTIGGKQYAVKTHALDQTPTSGHTSAVVSSDGIKTAIDSGILSATAPIIQQVGTPAHTDTFTSSDFAGLIWNGSAVQAANSTYDGFIVEVIPGQTIVVDGSAAFISNGSTFTNRPVVGANNPLRSNLNGFGTYTIQEGENFILFTVIKSLVGSMSVSFPATGMSADIANLQVQGSPLSGKKILCLGDSLTERKGTNGKGYAEYLAEFTGADVTRCAMGGATIGRRTGSYTPLTTTPSNVTQARAPFDVVCLCEALASQDYQYIDAGAAWLLANESIDYSELVTTIKGVDLSEYDIVTIFAGTNDYAAGNTIGDLDSDMYGQVNGALNKSIAALLGANPALRIFIFTPVVRYLNNSVSDANWGDNYTNAQNETMRQFAAHIMANAEYNHIPACDLYNTLGWNRLNFGNYFNIVSPIDTTHPTYVGFESIALRFGAFMTANLF